MKKLVVSVLASLCLCGAVFGAVEGEALVVSAKDKIVSVIEALSMAGGAILVSLILYGNLRGCYRMIQSFFDYEEPAYKKFSSDAQREKYEKYMDSRGFEYRGHNLWKLKFRGTDDTEWKRYQSGKRGLLEVSEYDMGY